MPFHSLRRPGTGLTDKRTAKDNCHQHINPTAPYVGENIIMHWCKQFNVQCTERLSATFTQIASVNGWYKMVKQNLDWSAAGLACRQLHKDAHLLVINDEQEQLAVARFLSGNGLSLSLLMFTPTDPLDQKLLCSQISSPGVSASALCLVNLVGACAHHSLNLTYLLIFLWNVSVPFSIWSMSCFSQGDQTTLFVRASGMRRGLLATTGPWVTPCICVRDDESVRRPWIRDDWQLPRSTVVQKSRPLSLWPRAGP